MATVSNYLDELLDPLAESLTPAAAERIIDLKPSARVLDRVRELGEKSNEGTLTDSEREEYRALADAGTLLAILRSKAHQALTERHD